MTSHAPPLYSLSRYAVLSDDVFRNDVAEDVILIYLASTATLGAVSATAGRALRSGACGDLGEDELAALVGDGVLVAEGTDELSAILEGQRNATADSRRRRFALLPTSYCNMGCSYCGQVHTRDMLRGNHRDVTCARVLAAIRDEAVTEVQVNWFGGEPLTAYGVMCSMGNQFWREATALRKCYSSKVVTNGSLLTLERLVGLVDTAHVDSLEITLDGPESIHDVHRPLKRGGGSFRRVVAVLSQAVTDSRLAGIQFVIRTNVDRTNAPFIDKFIDEMREAKLNTPQVGFYLAPVHSWGNDVSSLALSTEEFADSEYLWLAHFIAAGLNVDVLPSAITEVVCSAVSRQAELITSTGRVFACSEYPLVPGMERHSQAAVTDLDSDELRPIGEFDGWDQELKNGSVPCQSCDLLPVCGGACPKAWHEGNRPCPSMKLNFQRRLNLAASINGLKRT